MVDPEPTETALWREVFRRTEGILWIDSYPTAELALGPLVARSPDVILIAIDLPAMGGLELVRQLREQTPRSALLLKGFAEPGEVTAAARLGAMGFLPVRATVVEMVSAVHCAHRGEFYWPQLALTEMVRFIQKLPDQITRREIEVLRLSVVDGLAQKQIAHRLGISSSTIEKHLSSARLKLGVLTNARAWETARAQGCF